MNELLLILINMIYNLMTTKLKKCITIIIKFLLYYY